VWNEANLRFYCASRRVIRVRLPSHQSSFTPSEPAIVAVLACAPNYLLIISHPNFRRNCYPHLTHRLFMGLEVRQRLPLSTPMHMKTLLHNSVRSTFLSAPLLDSNTSNFWRGLRSYISMKNNIAQISVFFRLIPASLFNPDAESSR
jgi:hypothetical protein